MSDVLFPPQEIDICESSALVSAVHTERAPFLNSAVSHCGPREEGNRAYSRGLDFHQMVTFSREKECPMDFEGVWDIEEDGH